MDSPEPSKTVKSTANSAATTFPDSSPVQESPFSNYVSSLSPINPLKAAHVPQGILGLSSPPLVFTSPRTVPHRETTFLQRSQLSQISSLEISEKYDGSKTFGDNLEESDTYSRGLITDTQKDNDVENATQDQPGSSSGCVDEYLNDPVDVDCANSVAVVDQNVKQSNDVLQSSLYSLNNSKSDNKNYVRANVDTSQAQSKQAEEDPHGQSIYEIKPVQVEEKQSGSKHPSKECPNIKSDLTMDHDLETNQYDALGTQVSQLQRGLSRRCLQFEEARRRTNVNFTPSSNLINNVTGSGSTTSATELLTASSIKKQVVNLSRPSNSTFALHCPGNSPMVLSKPSGIGLHLNSVPLPMGGHSAMTINKSTPVTSSYRVDSKSYSSKLSKLVEKVTIGPKDGMLRMKGSIADSAVTSESFTPAEPLNNLQQPEYHAIPLNKGNFNSEQADNFEEFSQLSPTKKKRKTSSSIDGDGCKRCNCKKSKCLKLYCDCFAAGIYCAEPCACQGCFNRPEYEDTVLETRQQIESRNPLAFAPKVVQHGTEAVSKEDGSGLMPSFARHKRGCNCKKSMCLKKYCECYQANVGCSSECRCEECKNVYGRKEEYGTSEEIVSKRVCEERLKGRDDDKLGRVATDKDFLHAELYELHNLTPSTPSFQHSDHGKDAPKSQFNSSRYIPSPESDFSILPSYTRYIGSPRNSLSNDMIPERNKEIVDIDSFGQGMDYNASEVMDQFSPRYNALYDNCDRTPSRISSITNVASSASSKTRDCVSGSRFQLCSGGGHFPSGRSLKWRSSPITPMSRLGETKNQSHDSDSRLHDILGDDTPEILKEASIPIPSVKASSPNKKRVSPPHNHVHGLRSSSSVGLRSGRKFILTAVSSSPSLVPCDKSNGSTDDKGSNK